MAYVDLEFYKTKYYGNVVSDADFPRISERASDFLDLITFDRLVDGLPDNERAQTKIKKAICALTDKMYGLELAEKKAMNAAKNNSDCGITSGIITSKSSGSESISYASPTEIANSAKSWSNIYSVAGDEKETNKLLKNTVVPYLMGIKDNTGVPLLYAGRE